MKYIYENLNDDNIHRKERILRGCVFAAIIGFIIVGGVLGSAAAQETPDEKNKASLVLTLEEALTDNDWRPLSKIDASTDGILDQPLQANCPQNLGSCPENHGVYDRDPYFRIARDANGSLRLISDGDLMADVQVGSDGSIRIQFSDGNSATIEMNSDECISAKCRGGRLFRSNRGAVRKGFGQWAVCLAAKRKR